MLPVVSMSRATTTCAGSLSERTIASVMRMLAWCGTNATRSSEVMPAASSACVHTLEISPTAQRNTAWPCMVRTG